MGLLRFIGLAIGAICGTISSTLMTFIGVAMNYGFHPGFFVIWLKAAAVGYLIGVALIVPYIQHFVLRHAAVP